MNAHTRPMIRQGAKGHPVKEAILHTAALEDPGSFFSAHPTAASARDEIDAWHRARGWRGIGYHFVVAPDGVVVRGRPVDQIGAHVQERNRGTLGICMLNVRPHRGVTRFEDYFTEDQRRAVKALLRQLAEQTELKWVTGHNDYTDMKECPGFQVISTDWMPGPPDARFAWLWNMLERLRRGRD